MADKDALALFDEIWKFRLAESPELATFCGFHQYDDCWDDIGEEAYTRREERLREFLNRAEKLKSADCSPDVSISLQLLREDLQQYVTGTRFKTQYLPINYLEGIHIDCNLTISYMKFNTVQDFDKFIARLEKLPKRIRAVIPMLKKGVQHEIVMFKCSVEPVVENIANTVSQDVSKIGLMKPFTEEHPDVPPESLSKFEERAKDLIKSGIFPALIDLKDYLEKEYLGHTRAKAGIGSLPSGQAWYQQCLNFHLSCPMSPQQVHDLGLREVERITAQILSVAKKEELGQTLPEIFKNIVKKQANHFQTKDEILQYIRHLCHKEIRPKLKRLFKNIPNLPLCIKGMPEYMAAAPQGYYVSGTPDGSRESIYYINVNKLHECYPFILPALSLHEAEPGHHMQMGYSLAATHLPDFRRYAEDSKYYLSPNKLSYYTAYAEGWGLYSEALGEELGMYTDSFPLLGRYAFEIFRATRLVVDTGLHAFGWSREKAAQYMIDNNMSPESELRSEVDRYITWPGQACAYKIGEIKIWELRRKAEKALGDKFDIQAFHSCLLTCGPLSLTILEQLVDTFIQQSK